MNKQEILKSDEDLFTCMVMFKYSSFTFLPKIPLFQVLLIQILIENSNKEKGNNFYVIRYHCGGFFQLHSI